MSRKTLLKEEQYLIDRYGDNLVGLIGYGSMVFGRPRAGSLRDYWVIYRDYEDFHSRNEEFYQKSLNKKSTVEQQIKANKEGPNFYLVVDREHEIRIKTAVMQEDDFFRFCTSEPLVVKGRMQKPLKIVLSSDKIKEGIESARKEGVELGINLVNKEFTFDDFLFAVLSLSYRAEIRPEGKNKKIYSIIDKGKSELDRIYRPLLENLPFVEKKGDETYVDTRLDETKKELRKKTMKYLKRLKWSKQSFKILLRNYASFNKPIKYIFQKAVGELTKIFKYLFVYPFFRKKTAVKMLNEYRKEISEFFDAPEDISIGEVVKQDKGVYKAELFFGDGTEGKKEEVWCVPLKKGKIPEDMIARDVAYKFIIVSSKQ
jgi:hypothetical protein